MQIQTFTVGPFAENTYMLTKQNEALLVDPGFHEQGEMYAFQQKLDDASAHLRAVLLTHAHVDHILGLHKVLEQYDVPVYLNHADLYLWNHFASQAQMFGFQTRNFDFMPQNLPIQKSWSIGLFTFAVRYTPGHAPDHVSLYSAEDNAVIAGDALFKEGIGRTDLYKGNMEVLKKSIKEQLYSLPPKTKVYPGHGPSTTIEYEKQANPFVQG